MSKQSVQPSNGNSEPAIIKVSFNYTEFEIDCRAIWRFRPTTAYEQDSIGHDVLTRISYLFSAYVNESVDEIADRIACTHMASQFGYLTQPDGFKFGFLGPGNAFGPVPIDLDFEHQSALSGVIINKRLRKVRETSEQVHDVLLGCGGLAVPPLPNVLDVEGWADDDEWRTDARNRRETLP